MSKFLRTTPAAVCGAIICTMLWGTAFPFIKLGYAAFGIADGDLGSMLLFAGCRFFLAGLMVLLVLTVSARRLVLPKRKDVLPVATLGLVLTAAQYLLTYIGIGFTTAANTSIITACSSFLTVLFVPLFIRGDRLTLLKILGCVLGIGGVLVINRGGGVTAATFFGDALIFGSTVCSAGGNIIAKKISAGRNPLMVTAYQLLIGGGVLILAGLLCGGRIDFAQVRGVLILLWLAFVSAAAFALWTALLKYHPASRIAVFNLLVPIIGTVLSGILLGENVFRGEILAALLMIAGGIVLVNISKKGGSS